MEAILLSTVRHTRSYEAMVAFYRDRLGMTAVGVAIARGLEDAPWGHRSFDVDDPDGFRLWFYEDLGAA